MSQPINSSNQADQKTGSWDRVFYIILTALCLLGLLWFLLFSTISAELTCERSPIHLPVRSSADSVVDCSLVRHTVLQTIGPVEIHSPVAVDVLLVQTRKHKQENYRVEIRTSDSQEAIRILSTYDNTILNTVEKVNAFIQSSNASSLTVRFPEKMAQKSAS